MSSILRAAGLLGAWVEPRDFWLLNPREDLRTAANVFPAHLYHWHHFEEPVAEFDFTRFPLVAGDLLYLHAQGGDTFEHILIVNRVDAKGRPYTVSNFFTETGTIIEERLLHDPANPKRGQFRRWADRSIRNTIGNTGGGGFRVWRVKDGRYLDLPQDEASLTLRAKLDELFLSEGGKWFAQIKALRGRPLYLFNPYERFHPASTIKVGIGMAFFDWLDRQAVPDIEGYLSNSGTSGRTYTQLLKAMIVKSEEEATDTLVEFLGESEIESLWQAWGYTLSRVDPRRSSADEIVRFFEELYRGTWHSAESRSILLDLLATYSPNDDTRSGLLKELLPTESIIYNKRGSLVQAPRVLADSGLLHIPAKAGKRERVYLFTFHGLGSDGSSYETLEEKLDQAILHFGEFLTAA